MKKLAVLSAIALLLVTFAGCRTSNDRSSGAPASTTAGTIATTTAGTEAATVVLPLTKQIATQLALDHAGVSNEEVRHLHVRRDRDNGIYHYDVDFRHGEYFYAYEISEETGEILKLETEHDRRELPQTQIAKEEAIKIALEHEEFTEADVSVLRAELDREDHRYEIEFVRDGIEYTYEICAEFGKILDIDKERVK